MNDVSHVISIELRLGIGTMHIETVKTNPNQSQPILNSFIYVNCILNKRSFYINCVRNYSFTLNAVGLLIIDSYLTQYTMHYYFWIINNMRNVFFFFSFSAFFSHIKKKTQCEDPKNFICFQTLNISPKTTK